ncbi:MAG: purine-nucleoside phosphorylase [Clostridia bacterium]|nr:purine-nucleoside phosphorylase [Clostridia bacterium]MBQ6177852.1 purine-nucleoside phosphorylase [Bacteroidales bacterium]MBR4458873.1 purine-nucleoside phosphorylase [Clostridia bacterium]
MLNVPTPHISANAGDFAPTVLMPGDPLRSKFIADNYLTDAVLVNNTRGVQGYTGTYKGKRVSVMASGMGMPSIGIYSYELFQGYHVQSIIRIGSAGAINQRLKLRDIVLGMSAYTNSGYGIQYGFRGDLAPCCSYRLLNAAMEAGKTLGIEPVPGAIFSSDTFYDEHSPNDILEKLGVLAVEMEAASLYLNAARTGKEALCICTISDNPKTGDSLPAQDRQTSFTQMIELALEIA